MIECVRKYARGTRVFALGIGSNVSMELVNGLAKAGRGHVRVFLIRLWDHRRG